VTRRLRPLAVVLAAAAAGFLVALALPRGRWRSRSVGLPSGPWPPLELDLDENGGSAAAPPLLELDLDENGD
jgi:hypothetical protein